MNCNRLTLISILFINAYSCTLFCEPPFRESHDLVTKSGNVYRISDIPSTEEQSQLYDSLSDTEKEKFNRNRTYLVEKAARLMDRFTSQDKVQKMVEALNAGFWDKPGILSKANELGVSVEGGVDAGAMAGKWGLYGITGLGIISSVDTSNKSIVMELYQDFDRTTMALPFYGGVGAFGSVLLSATNHNWKEPLRPERGEGFCTLGVAGCITNKNLRLGVSWGVAAGFPPTSVLTNTVWRIPYARIAISPKWPYVQYQVIGGDVVRGAIHRVLTAPIVAIKTLVNLCRNGQRPTGEKK